MLIISNTQIYRSINIITDLSYTFYDDLIDGKYSTSKFNIMYTIDKSSAEVTLLIHNLVLKKLISKIWQLFFALI